MNIISKIKVYGSGALCLGILAYGVNGVFLGISEKTFCGTVNRFVTTNGNDERISITPDGEVQSLGYNVRNHIYIPFAFYLGAERRKEQLTIGQTYEFTSIGWRRVFPRSIPKIVKHEAVSDCAAASSTRGENH